MLKAETLLVRKIKSFLTSLGDKVEKIHADGYQTSGTPDLLCCCRGRAVVIEVKVGVEEPTERQHYELMAWRASGATVGVARSVDDALTIRQFALRKKL